MHQFTLLTILLSLFFQTPVQSQDKDAVKFASTITQEDLKSYLYVLASDSLEGRETGKAGQKKAAAFIRDHFEDFGLESITDNYFQKFNLVKTHVNMAYLKFGGTMFMEKVLFYGDGSFEEETSLDLVFLGKGEEADYKKHHVKGKAVALIVKDYRQWKTKAALAREKGAAFVLMAYSNKYDDFMMVRSRFEQRFVGNGLQLPSPEGKEGVQAITYEDFLSELFNQEVDDLKPGTKARNQISVKYIPENTYVETENVLAYVEGSDLKEELLVITAHYDHEGVKNGQVYNGADDDASGTSAVMEIAEAFAEARKAGKGPRRSIIFMTVTGEEKGLLGSRYYSENPVLPLENTVVNLNIDMIGRVDKKHKGNPDYVYLIGTKMLSDELHELSEEVNKTYSGLELDYRYNDKDDPNRFYYRSDHYNFAKNNIPVIFYFNGTHEDYHQPSDTADKINFEKLEKISRLIFYTAWEISNRDERLKLNNP